jgi:hypothetical protein
MWLYQYYKYIVDDIAKNPFKQQNKLDNINCTMQLLIV